MFFRLPGKALFARQKPRSALSWDSSTEALGSVQEPFPARETVALVAHWATYLGSLRLTFLICGVNTEVLQWDDFASWGHLAMSGGYFCLSQPGRELLLASGGEEPGSRLNTLRSTGRPLEQRRKWPRRSVVPSLSQSNDVAPELLTGSVRSCLCTAQCREGPA